MATSSGLARPRMFEGHPLRPVLIEGRTDELELLLTIVLPGIRLISLF
jgi:hypothetical protein